MKTILTGELQEMTSWVVEQLGPDVPMHFTAFHPDWKMRNILSTPRSTLSRARQIAIDNGVRYAYTGNVHDPSGSSTCCHQCGELLIERDWYQLGNWGLDQIGVLRLLWRETTRTFYGKAGWFWLTTYSCSY